MSRIYISSSWSNAFQPVLVYALRSKGHQVYDFRHTASGKERNVWDELGIKKDAVNHADYLRAIKHPVAIERFDEHFKAMQDADTCILLLPCGRSSHAEAGIMKGMGKRVFIYNYSDVTIPELMYRMFDGYYHGKDGLAALYEELAVPIPGVCRICGCTENNPCYHPEYGFCSWIDEEETLCSHCAHLETDDGEYCLVNDPQTTHCINDKSHAYK